MEEGTMLAGRNKSRRLTGEARDHLPQYRKSEGCLFGLNVSVARLLCERCFRLQCLIANAGNNRVDTAINGLSRAFGVTEQIVVLLLRANGGRY